MSLISGSTRDLVQGAVSAVLHMVPIRAAKGAQAGPGASLDTQDPSSQAHRDVHTAVVQYMLAPSDEDNGGHGGGT